MFDSGKLKAGVAVVLLLGILAGFDHYSSLGLTGAATADTTAADEAETLPNTNTLTLKADSFSVIALGAAFGSYYNAGKSTCKPDNIFLASWVYAPTTEYDEETGEQYESESKNIMLFDVDADSKLAVKPNGHRADIDKLKPSEKGLATFKWGETAGAWILNEGPECTLALAYGSEMLREDYALEYAQLRLADGANFVSVVPQMIGKTMEQVKGDCDLTGAYSNFGHSVPSASDALTKGAWDWWTSKHTFAQNELGLGMWLYSENTCRLFLQNVNLAPELVINPNNGLKSGDTIEVMFYIKNTGREAATPLGIKRRSTATLSNAIYFYKDKEYGQEAISPILAPIDFLGLKDKAIQPGEAGKVLLAKQTVKIPEDFSGDLVIAAVVDAQSMYWETNEDDNRQSLSIPLTEKAAGPPNLAPIAVEVFPAIEKFPVEILSAFITVENKGEAAAVAEKQFLENKISILQGNVEVCKDSRSDHVTIKPGESHEFWLTPELVNGFGAACVLDDEKANYWAVVEVDTLQTSPAGAKGVVTESNENDNKKTFPLKGPQKCSSLGAREAGKYCSIEAETLLTWLTQKAAAQPCSQNFECQFEYCVKGMCVTEAQKGQILKIVS